jgi:hypothetical protein
MGNQYDKSREENYIKWIKEGNKEMSFPITFDGTCGI